MGRRQFELAYTTKSPTEYYYADLFNSEERSTEFEYIQSNKGHFFEMETIISAI